MLNPNKYMYWNLWKEGYFMRKFVELEHISKEFANKKVLHDISLTIEENQVIAFLGGNGTGKSTILRIIAGLERPNSGKVMYSNKQLRIGYVPDRFPKMLRFTPSEYLHYVEKIGGIPEDDLTKRIPNFLHRFQLKDMKNNGSCTFPKKTSKRLVLSKRSYKNLIC